MRRGEISIARAAGHLLHLPFECWHFGDSVGFEALLAASEATGEECYAAFAHGFCRAWAARSEGFRPLDCTAPGLAMVRLAERTGDGRLLEAAARLADYLAGRRRLDGVYSTWESSPLRHPYGPGRLPPDEAALVRDPGAGVFVDCLHFDPPFFTALGRATGDRGFVSAGVAQALGYVRLLQDAETGLFHHFWLERTGRRYVPGWGRGQGWALLGLLDVLEQTAGDPVDDADRRRLESAARRLAEAMVAFQRADGHWYAVVHDPDSGDETSTAAFMVAGFGRMTRLGIAAPGAAEAAARAAAAVRASTDGDAILRGVSAAVWACTLPSHYAHVPRDFVVPWGQGPLVLPLLEAQPNAAESATFGATRS